MTNETENLLRVNANEMTHFPAKQCVRYCVTFNLLTTCATIELNFNVVA